jgi:hypothetical protein
MEKIITKGQLLFGIAMLAFGVENFICARLGLVVRGVPWFPTNAILACIAGVVFLVAGLSIAANVRAGLSAIVLGLLFLLCVLLLEVPLVVAAPRDLGIRSVFFEGIALGGAALILAGILPSGHASQQRNGLLDRLIASGPYLFGISSLVFGIDHFLILGFIASLVPAWMHAGMFWAYLTGGAFVAAGISVLIKRIDELAGTMLGTMFLLWFLLLHAPRVVSAFRSHAAGAPDEWSSAFIALGMCGGSWICAWNARQRRRIGQPPVVS